MGQNKVESKTKVTSEQLAHAKALFDTAIIKIVGNAAEVIKNYVMIFFANAGKLGTELKPQPIPLAQMTPEFKMLFESISKKVLAKLDDAKVNEFFDKLGKAAKDPKFKVNLIQAISLQHVETLFKELNDINSSLIQELLEKNK